MEISHKTQLVEYLAAGCKTVEKRRIGTEHEKFAFSQADHKPVPYEGERGIKALLEGLQRINGWEPVLEKGHVIALKGKDGASITLEPGGQVELSGAPLRTVHQTCAEVSDHLTQVKAVAEPLGLGMLGLGFHPSVHRDDVPWMPKGRYAIMRRYMPTRGSHGLDMMLRTCTVQVNLDYTSEADMVRMFRISLALQPLATALFANSPFVDGHPSGLLSSRSRVWLDTDPDRTGMLPFVFEDGMGFERYVDYMLDVPMYFVYRDGTYIDASGQSFRDFMAGRLPALPGQRPTFADWTDHLTTAFPEVRLKQYLEMRGADGGPWNRLCALPALWVGLLYDDLAKAEAWELCHDWTEVERHDLRALVPQSALNTPFRRSSVRELAWRMLEISRAGLERRRQRDRHGRTEAYFLDPLFAIAESGKTPAEDLLDHFHGPWGKSVEPVFEDYAY